MRGSDLSAGSELFAKAFFMIFSMEFRKVFQVADIFSRSSGVSMATLSLSVICV